jgi:hypothetical protein
MSADKLLRNRSIVSIPYFAATGLYQAALTDTSGPKMNRVISIIANSMNWDMVI